MQASLLIAGLTLGAAATPHCALMCGAPCAAMTHGRPRATALFQAGRLAGYAAGGALAASALALLGAWARTTAWLAPLWTLLQLAFLALGIWWLATGRMPPRLLRDGPTASRHATSMPSWRIAGTGLAWVAWPCGVLQGALLLASLAGDAVDGAAIMALFALASGPALLVAPGLWAAWRRFAGGSGADVQAAGYRVAGAALSITAALALMHALHDRISALCAT